MNSTNKKKKNGSTGSKKRKKKNLNSNNYQDIKSLNLTKILEGKENNNNTNESTNLLD